MREPPVTSAAYPQSVLTPETHTDSCFSTQETIVVYAFMSTAAIYHVHTVDTQTSLDSVFSTPAAEGQTCLSIIPQISQ